MHLMDESSSSKQLPLILTGTIWAWLLAKQAEL